MKLTMAMKMAAQKAIQKPPSVKPMKLNDAICITNGMLAIHKFMNCGESRVTGAWKNYAMCSI